MQHHLSLPTLKVTVVINPAWWNKSKEVVTNERSNIGHTRLHSHEGPPEEHADIKAIERYIYEWKCGVIPRAAARRGVTAAASLRNAAA
ncbi:hypothetical protein EVAR_92079_1 [Eumeta japonica]|uniref:Uncharacterized protein n=1 Tax=Eumeta variegata TaxID=151549 RepID=A0A4C1SYY6_EUMVA|nr:hypothetical protein EVAR_92079_1 [Eumeta japonica]